MLTGLKLVHYYTEESSSRTGLERVTLARLEKRDLKGVFRDLPGVTQQIIGSRSTPSTLFVRGVSSGLVQLIFDGSPRYNSLANSFNLATIPS